MRTIIEFLIKHGTWFTFVIFAAISCVMLFRENPYQQHVYMTSAGAVTKSVYGATNYVTGYFHLRDTNQDLQQRTADLELELIRLRADLQRANDIIYGDSVPPAPSIAQYRFIMAHVINNSIVHSNNFITINKGSADGIQPEMGVVDHNGVVGIVNVVGPHSARLLSLLNSSFKLSCKVKGSNAFGSLSWDGRSPREAVLSDLPRHVEFALGDTIVTSGYSTVFPPDIPVGTVIAQSRDIDDNFYSLRIQLLTDFATLSTVRVIENFAKEELNEVETDVVNTSGKF